MLASAHAQDCQLTMNVRVLDDHGHPVVDVTRDQIRAEIGGAPAKIIAVAPAQKPEMLLLIDASSSMKGTWDESIAAARQLAAFAGDNLSAVLFRERILAEASTASDVQALIRKLPSIAPARGGTAFYDMLIQAGSSSKDRNVVIVAISDGDDNFSRNSSDQVVEQYSRSAWPPVFGLILDYEHEQPRRRYFRKIATATGGLTATPPSASKVTDAVNVLAAAIYAPVAITMQPSRAISKPAKLKIDVVGPDGKSISGYRVLQSEEVAPCR